jgi:ubiquitin-protein ligase
MSSTPFHHARLLRDVHELNSHPYPNIFLHSHPALTTACLILTPPGLPPIHVTCTFPPRYPIHPPRITIQTKFIHPNVFGDYICASILNTNEGYTPAYTLKGIAIQMLSFFNSEKVQQQYDWEVVDIKAYRERKAARAGRDVRESFVCAKCGFPTLAGTTSGPAVGGLGDHLGRLAVSSPSTDQGNAQFPSIVVQGPLGNTDTVTETDKKKKEHKPTALEDMPSEILIRICDFLESEELIVFMRAWEVVGGAKGVVTEYGLIRKRELLCFVTKEGFGTERLGVGVRVWGGGKVG